MREETSANHPKGWYPSMMMSALSSSSHRHRTHAPKTPAPPPQPDPSGDPGGDPWAGGADPDDGGGDCVAARRGPASKSIDAVELRGHRGHGKSPQKPTPSPAPDPNSDPWQGGDVAVRRPGSKPPVKSLRSHRT